MKLLPKKSRTKKITSRQIKDVLYEQVAHIGKATSNRHGRVSTMLGGMAGI